MDTPQNKPFITFRTAGFINFASQQNSLPVIHELSVETGQEDLRNVVLRITFEPEFADPIEVRSARLDANTKVSLGTPNVMLRPAFLDNLSDRLKGLARLELRADDAVVATLSQEVNLLGRNQSPGLNEFFPEIAASFVLPKDPAVPVILRRAHQIIEDSKSGPGLIGYQDGNNQSVAAQVEAIYKAIAEQGIAYVSHGQIFDENRQIISTPSDILRQKLGNCLDLTLLFASCLEESGLNPLVVVIDGHAFTACWLVDKDFDEIATDDGVKLRKIDDLGEIICLESTLVCGSNAASPAAAHKAGLEHLRDGAEKKFRFAIDIHRARRNGIRPIPNVGEPPNPIGHAGDYRGKASDGSFTVREGLGEINKAKKHRTRLDQWTEKLLDLTLNNRLLNFKDSQKNYIPVLAPSIGKVEDIMAAGKALQFLPGTGQSKGGAARSQSALTDEALKLSLESDLASSRLRSGLDEDSHFKKIFSIADEAKKAIEETGSNKLYLAVGVLNWRSQKKPGAVIRAPILLVPIEIKRKSALDAYTIRKLEEETLINSSLIEMLKSDFGMEVPGLSPLPEDDSGVDVAKVLGIFRHAVRDMKDWEVKEELWVGLYSFAKYLLWKDLTSRSEQLKGNPIVKHLIDNSKQTFPASGDTMEPAALDYTFKPSEVMVTRSADSSQLSAVMAAAAGHDFVLEGPPGTGKSQTITNIIAQCMFAGKRVLFVAEKRAALEVVHKRLKEDGLAGFCLELHSNKIETGKVFAQFEDTAKLAALKQPASWQYQADSLKTLRDKLNEYVLCLHKQSPNGLSAYDCVAYIIPRKKLLSPEVKFEATALEMSKQTLEDVRAEFANLQRAYELVGTPNKHPLSLCEQDDWGINPEAEFFPLIDRLCEAAKRVQTATERLGASAQITISDKRSQSLRSYRNLAQLVLEPASAGPGLLHPLWAETSAWLDRMTSQAEERITISKTFEAYDSDKLSELETSQITDEWDTSFSKIQPFRWFKQFGIRGRLSATHLQHERPTAEEVSPLLKAAARLRDLRIKAERDDEFGKAALGSQWNERKPEPQKIIEAKNWAARWNSHASSIAEAGSPKDEEFRKLGRAALVAGREGIQPDSERVKAIKEFIASIDELHSRLESFISRTRISEKVFNESVDLPSKVTEIALSIKSGLSETRNWSIWQRTRAKCLTLGIRSFVSYVEGKAPADLPSLAESFETNFRSDLFNQLVGRSPALRTFTGNEHQANIEAFCQKDKEFTELSRQIVAATLAARIPSNADKSELGAEFGRLMKEVGKKTKRKAVRQLISEHPNAIARVKPCFLMSPLSVAQFLDANTQSFDLVVFDEASQIQVWDSIGAIARGKQLIVVGDPHQLPPTSFFTAKGEGDDTPNEDGSTVDADEESILDELRSFQLRERSLKWHYRSKQEGLIAFSNRTYYKNGLLTFPSSNTGSFGVTLKYLPNAVYDKGETSTNPIEAKALVDEFLRRIKTKDGAKLSYGIVTFSLPQREVVLKCLEDARRANPEIEEHFGEKCPVDGEPVFVKNLESVQGDERDVILFSICYGPDKEGKVSHNFGPLTQTGGHRRLNVAITRAKHEAIVFTCMKSEQIDLERTSATGVRDLKGFLEFAERGNLRAASLSSTKQALTTKGLEGLIAQRLESEGYQILTGIGMSNYRIDIGVIHPKDPTKYVLGIECDGDCYQKAETARDRDSLRGGVLTTLGWRLHRVWSMDWWHNPEKEFLRIREAILSATEAEDAKTAARAVSGSGTNWP